MEYVTRFKLIGAERKNYAKARLFTDSFPLCESDDLILKHAA